MGSVGNKYRVHEVAKDFGVPTKQITEILTKYAETPKNHMQVLEDRELSLIFEYLTQHNQVSGIQVIFAEGAKPAEKKQQPAAKPAEKKPEGKGESRSAKQETKPVSRVPQTKVVDTRKATAVNLDKYDEKLQDMAPVRQAGGFCHTFKRKDRMKLAKLTLIKTLAVFFQNIKFCKTQSRVNF